MNDPNGFETEAAGLDQILFDEGRDIARGEGVEIENIGDGNTNRLHEIRKGRRKRLPCDDYQRT
jgi:hypothetical protein